MRIMPDLVRIMSRHALATLAIITLLSLLSTPLYANPTGSPLSTFSVYPCRVLDTRVAMGPVMAGTSMQFHVRGKELPASQGAARRNCGIPPEAESVVINIQAVSPTSAGHLRVNGVGFVTSPQGTYTRLNFGVGENISNEMTVSLCNVFLFPHPHQPCPHPNPDLYEDIAVIPSMAGPSNSVHLVADVVGYQSRMWLTSAVAGVVEEVEERPTATSLVLTTGMRVVCQLPYSDPANCDAVLVDWMVVAAGHVGDFEGNIAIYAHGDIQGTPPVP